MHHVLFGEKYALCSLLACITAGLLERVTATLTVDNLTFSDSGSYVCQSTLTVIGVEHTNETSTMLQVLGERNQS